jgi:hypothetical protein
VVLVVVDGEADESFDIKDAERRVRPMPVPPGRIERVDGRDRSSSRGGEGSKDLLERRVVVAGRRAGLRPGPLWVVERRDVGLAPLVDLGFDGDQVPQDLRDAPLAVTWVGRGGSRDGRRLQTRREAGEVGDEILPAQVGMERTGRSSQS